LFTVANADWFQAVSLTSSFTVVNSDWLQAVSLIFLGSSSFTVVKSDDLDGLHAVWLKFIYDSSFKLTNRF